MIKPEYTTKKGTPMFIRRSEIRSNKAMSLIVLILGAILAFTGLIQIGGARLPGEVMIMQGVPLSLIRTLLLMELLIVVSSLLFGIVHTMGKEKAKKEVIKHG